jgi:DNA-binding beta-propeller fold protein YncE
MQSPRLPRTTSTKIVFVCATLLADILGAQQSTDQRLMVGRHRDDVIVTPVNQVLTPAGTQVELPGMRPQAIALSPNGTLLIASGKTSELIVIDPDTGEVRQRVELPAEGQSVVPPDAVSPNILHPDTKGQVAYTGLIFSRDGRHIFLSNVNGSIKVFSVAEDGKVAPSHTFALPPGNAPRRTAEIPSGLAQNSDGTKLYVCGNLSNQLLELDAVSGKLLRQFDVGAVPYDVVIVGDLAIVSNWAGRRPGEDDLTGPAGRGTVMRVDPVRHIASEGSVSFIDLAMGVVLDEVVVGLHASALAVSPDQEYVICANAGSDHLSVIEIATRQIVDTIWAKANPAELLGAAPNAIAFAADGQTLYVANGSQNAVAVIDLDLDDRGESKISGLIPVGWFPGAIAYDAGRNKLHVANIKGLPIQPKPKDGTEGFNTHHYHGTLSLVSIPTAEELVALSVRAANNMAQPKIQEAFLPARENQPARPVPERIGEPSTIKHVVYMIKENRTYDQVFGAMPNGNGNADLCIFGREITPNYHAIADQFGLLDNTYCAGILSADGHQWSTTAMSTDYMEKSFAGFPRSYPDGMELDDIDAMAYSTAGFIWDNAVKHNVSIRNYGEFMMPTVRWRDPNQKGSPGYMDCYNTWKGESNAVIFECEPGIESVRDFSPTNYVGWEMSVPDQYRADVILNELKDFTARGEFPSLTIICLPNDHTSGTSPGCPTPASCMADNDLAMGRIVEGLSHSPFWKEMAIFVIEDDPQAGWDHVSGYRTTSWVISPWSRRGETISTLYNTTSILRTIEQILGMPPMNRFDATATPMFDCFREMPDFAPYDVLANTIPLDQMNPVRTASIPDPQLRADAEMSATLNFRQVDAAPEDVLNRILWRSQKGSSIPYPTWAITLVEDDDDEIE